MRILNLIAPVGDVSLSYSNITCKYIVKVPGAVLCLGDYMTLALLELDYQRSMHIYCTQYKLLKPADGNALFCPKKRPKRELKCVVLSPKRPHREL